MQIYVRTEEGQKAAYSMQSALPRKLKSILKVVDGKTRTQVFKNNLHSFGDVEGILHSLEIAGLLKAVSESGQDAQVDPENASSQRIQSQRQRHWSSTKNPLETDSEQIFLQTAMQAQYLPASGLRDSVNVSVADALSGGSVLRTTLDEMANFILAHMPEQSFQILKEIEEITSLEVLAATLGGYEQMVSNMGQAGVAHLQSIKTTLRQHL